MKGEAKTPAADKLFNVEEESEDLNAEDAEYFHRLVARFLFVAKRTRPDIQVAVGYLCTRVKNPNKSDYEKLTRLVRYIRHTIHLPLLIGWDESGVMLWSVDASFAVHNDYRSHTGATLTLGKGALI